MELSNRSPVALYVQLKDFLSQEISEGRFKPHDQIPSERELCEQYNLSRTTVRQGISLAISEGLLYRIHGKGTYVAEQKIDQGLIRLIGFEETLLVRGLAPSMKVLEAQLVTGDVQVTTLLELPFGADVASFRLLGIANDEPMALFYYYLPGKLGTDAIRMVHEYEKKREWFSFTKYFQKTKQLDLGIAKQTFEAKSATIQQAEIMQIQEGTAIFKVTSIIYTLQDVPIELRHVYYRGDRYKFNISRGIGTSVSKTD